MKTGDLVELTLMAQSQTEPDDDPSGPAYRGIVIKGARSLGWFEVLFFDGDQMFYDAAISGVWNKKFWKVLNESSSHQAVTFRDLRFGDPPDRLQV